MNMTATLPGQTILLVEDDPPIRSLISYMLRGQGYQVLQTCNGQEALSLAEKHPGPIDLLVTDLVRPRTDGFTQGERLAESHPEIRVLFMSGYAERSAALREGLKTAEQAFLDRLLRTIRAQLDTEPARGPAPKRNIVIGPVL